MIPFLLKYCLLFSLLSCRSRCPNGRRQTISNTFLSKITQITQTLHKFHSSFEFRIFNHLKTLQIIEYLSIYQQLIIIIIVTASLTMFLSLPIQLLSFRSSTLPLFSIVRIFIIHYYLLSHCRILNIFSIYLLLLLLFSLLKPFIAL